MFLITLLRPSGRLKYILIFVALCSLMPGYVHAQLNTDQMMRIGRNTLYLEDYVLSIQYFNQVIAAKPYMAQPYFYRAIAKLSLDDYHGAEDDASLAIERNPFITNAYEVRGVARQNLGRAAEAIADYDRALESLPENRGLLFNKALAQAEIKDYDGSRATFALLLKAHPRFDNGYLGRARLNLVAGDTVSARADIDRALELNRNATNAYVMRADIAISSARDYASALSDMDEAIKLQPQFAGFFINRAFLRYSTDDYFGAMADYDYALQLEPLNATALFNRGLLRAEVHDNNKAIDDFSRVIQLDQNNYHALYNRAMLLKEIGDYRAAEADLNAVLSAFPDFASALFMRSECLRLMGRRAEGERDYRRSVALSKKPVAATTSDPSTTTDSTSAADSQEAVAARFTSLLTVADNAKIKEEFNTEGIKGRVQDRNSAIELEPYFAPSYYITTSELREEPYFVKELDDINATRLLRFGLMITNHEPPLDDEDIINSHFKSIEYYNSYIPTHTPRAIDYFGRAMDYVTLHNYRAALTDLDQAITLAPDFTAAYLMRAITCLRNNQANSPDAVADAAIASKMAYQQAMADLDKVIQLSPRMAIAHYNKGILLASATPSPDFTSAISSFTNAIELKPDMGEAYYNRGYLYLRLGNRQAGVADLSKAGELGIVASYNLLKRMTQ